ncbi:MAG: hypothetical protein NT162_02720, partial [Candidatus Woesebacteria bacterium]|nr:hypothetical protein [Candidatus Woesebacteria bacterium]
MKLPNLTVGVSSPKLRRERNPSEAKPLRSPTGLHHGYSRRGIDISRHKTIMFQILKDIYENTKISPYLGFKGGTSALMFYGL